MKKIASIALVLVLCVGMLFAGCAKQNASAFELALITDGASISDKGYNQSAWNGLKAYADENGKACRYYQPALDENGVLTEDIIAKYIELAVKNGAKYIVLPGEAFAVAAYEIAPTYKDVNFILLDAQPHAKEDNTLRVQSNVMCAAFNYYQGGFLAGYVSVTDGLKDGEKTVREYNTKLGLLASADNEGSAEYAKGYIAGVNYASAQAGVPVMLDYAVYNAPNLNYDYDFTVEPEYIDVSESKEETFKVQVVDGVGSGVYTDGENVTITANPAPEGKIFDHWEVKSDTPKVKDKKVNISSKKDSSMNLLVGDCDCTITAVWADADTVPITVMGENEAVYYAPKNSDFWVEAPAAPAGYVFSKWQTADESIIHDETAKATLVAVNETAIQLTPIYVKSDVPTFNISVKNGTGSGSYVAGDEVKVVADAPAEGKMFYKWKNVDSQGLSTGIAMENEYCYHTTFDMIDRYASVVEKMFDDGTEVVFAGGNEISDSVFTAASVFDYPVFGFGWGTDESTKGNCLASVVNDYGKAVQVALENYKGGSFVAGDCANECIYVTGKSLEQYYTDKKGEQKENAAFSADYAAVYAALAEGKTPSGEGLVTVNYWVK